MTLARSAVRFVLATLLAVPLAVAPAWGQAQITVTGTVNSPTGCPYAGGRGRANLVSGNGSGTQNWLYGLNPVPTTTIIYSLDSFGKFSMTLYNTAVISPGSAAPQYQFQFCSYNYPSTGELCFTMTPMALTSSQDISTQIQLQSVNIPACGSGPSGGLEFLHNGVTVGTEGKYNVIDTPSAVWTVTDNSGQSRIDAFLTASGGGGGTPAGAQYDVQINNPLGSFGVDTGVFTHVPSTHTTGTGTLQATTEVDVGASSTGVFDLGHWNGSAIDYHFTQSLDALAATYGISWPDAAPTGANLALKTTGSTDGQGRYKTQWTAAGSQVYLEPVPVLDATNSVYPGTPCPNADCARTLVSQEQDSAFMGPLPPTDPRSAVLLDNMCVIGDTATCSGTSTGVCTVVNSGNDLSCVYVVGSAVTPADTIYFEGTAICGLGCGSNTYTLSDDKSDTWTAIVNDTGGGTVPTYTAYTHAVGGTTTITFVLQGKQAFSGGYRGYAHMMVLRGSVVPDVHALQSFQTGGTPVFQPVTTLNATDTIIATQFVYTPSASCTYSPGSGYGLTNEANGTAYATYALSMGAATTNTVATGTYTPTFAPVQAGCQGQLGTALTTAFTQNVYGGPAKPTFRLFKYADLCAGLDFPCSITANKSLYYDGFVFQPLTYGSGLSLSAGTLTVSSAGSVAFSGITGGTNTTATMLVGTGASLGVTGSGTIAATSAPFSGLTTSSNTTATMTVGSGGTITVSGTGVNNANQVNGAVIPTSATPVCTNGSKQFASCSATYTQTICSGTITISAATFNANTTSSAYTGSCTGAATTDNVAVDFNGDPTAVTGFTANDTLTIFKYPTANTVNVKVQNKGSSNVTTGADVTLNYHVFR